MEGTRGHATSKRQNAKQLFLPPNALPWTGLIALRLVFFKSVDPVIVFACISMKHELHAPLCLHYLICRPLVWELLYIPLLPIQFVFC